MSSKPTLRLDWCGYDAARYAVTHWHYSRSMPTPPLSRVGVWEDGRFIGVVLFGRGSTQGLHKPYGIAITEICELVRVALDKHRSQVSKIVSIAMRMMTKANANLRLVVSFADPDEGHNGSIYQAMNWIYTGQSSDYQKFRDKAGRLWHPRQVSSTGVSRQYGEYRPVPKFDDCERVNVSGKHRYLYPLDAAMREQIAPLAKPYPKRPRAGSIGSDATAFHVDEGGATPTPALHQAAD